MSVMDLFWRTLAITSGLGVGLFFTGLTLLVFFKLGMIMFPARDQPRRPRRTPHGRDRR